MPAFDDKSDVELLLGYSRGSSHAAFEALVQRHGSMVYGVAKRVMSNHHDAQDVTQATFLVLSQEASKLTHGNSLGGWLHTVARRLSLNALKSRKHREEREKVAMNEDLPIETANAELQAEFGRELDTAISRLPERYRQPLVLFHLEGASIEEASQRLKLHSGTLRTRLARGRALLRDALVRRGVKIASVSMLASMLAAESKASVLSAAATHGISQAVLGKGALAASAQSFGHGLGGTHGLAGGALFFSIFTIMKTKLYVIAATAVVIAALLTTLKLAQDQKTDDPLQSELQRLAERRSDSPRSRDLRTRGNRGQRRVVTNHISELATIDDFERLLTAVLLIPDEQQRLQAMREQLEMHISDQVYRAFLEACRYQVDAEKQQLILFFEWVQADGEAAVQWSQQYLEKLDESYGFEVTGFNLMIWMTQDEDAAMAWQQVNLEPELLRELREFFDPFANILAMPADHIPEYLAASYAEESLPDDPNADPWIDILSVGFEEVLRLVGYLYPEASYEFMKASGFMNLEENGGSVVWYFEDWAARDPDAALAAAMADLKGEVRQAALLEVLKCWQTKYPDRSLDEVVDLNAFSEEQHRKLELSAAFTQARLDPEGALQRIMQASSPEMFEAMMNSVLGVTVHLAEEKTRDWVAALPAGEKKDMGLQLLMESLASNDLEGGVDLASQISDQNRRYKAVRAMLVRHAPTARDLARGLQLADQAHMIPIPEVHYFLSVNRINEIEEIDGAIDWLMQRHSEGRVMDRHEKRMNQIIHHLEARREALE